MKKDRYILLDIIRSVAITLVLVAHISQTTHYFLGNAFGIKGFYFVTLGGVAVSMFLVLSGLILQLIYGSKKIGYIKFIKKRVIRLYPVYYMSVLMSFGLILAYGSIIHKLPERIANLNISDIFYTLTGTYVFIGQWGGPLVPMSWFLGLIISMYLLFPFLSSSISRKPHISICILLIVSVLARLILGHYNFLPYRPLDWFPLCRIFEFSIGIYLGIILKKSIWQSCNNMGGNIRNLVTFISELSFPLFLIHYPLKQIITLLSQKIPVVFSIAIYLFVCIGISWGVMKLDILIQKALRKKSVNCKHTEVDTRFSKLVKHKVRRFSAFKKEKENKDIFVG